MHVLSAKAPEVDAKERRRYERYAVRCECWIESDQASIYGPTADLGLGGLFLRTGVPVEHGARVDILVALGEARHQLVRAEGVVTRIVPAERGRRHGVGVEFVQILEGEDTLETLK